MITIQIITRKPDGATSIIHIRDIKPIITNADDNEVAAMLLSTEVRANGVLPDNKELPSVRVHIFTS